MTLFGTAPCGCLVDISGTVNPCAKARALQGSAYHSHIAIALAEIEGMPSDPCQEAFKKEFGYKPSRDDQVWIGWVRCWNRKKEDEA
jgi:hypothetical protein